MTSKALLKLLSPPQTSVQSPLLQKYCRKFATKCSNSNNSPLAGVRVLDLSRILAGPFCTMLLGDLGAEIIKVEKPGAGDETRNWLPPETSDGVSCYFVSVNRNKQSVAIDLKKGSDLIRKLAANCDVLVENFIPGTMEKFGLGYDQLQSINPRLIYSSISGYGTTGPYASRGGYDVIAASIGGLLHITGPRDGEPCKTGVAMTDLATGLYLHGAIMAALLQRHATQKGQKIDCNLLSTQVSCLANLGSNYLNAGNEAKRLGTAHESIVPYQAFLTKDGQWITIGAGSDDQFHKLCDVTGLSQLKLDPKYATNASRVEHRTELISIFKKVIEEKSCAEWLQVFKTCNFPYGPVNNLEQVFKDPQVLHSQIVENVGPYRVVGPAVKFSVAENKVRFPPPRLGEHTRPVLQNVLGLSDSEINKLYQHGVVA